MWMWYDAAEVDAAWPPHCEGASAHPTPLISLGRTKPRARQLAQLRVPPNYRAGPDLFSRPMHIAGAERPVRVLTTQKPRTESNVSPSREVAEVA